jgi:hypothetical protein
MSDIYTSVFTNAAISVICIVAIGYTDINALCCCFTRPCVFQIVSANDGFLNATGRACVI